MTMKIMNKKGQGLIEYLLLLCLIAATTIGVVSVVGQNLKEQYQKASAAIRGEDGKSVEFTKPSVEQTKKRGLSDWEGGAQRSE